MNDCDGIETDAQFITDWTAYAHGKREVRIKYSMDYYHAIDKLRRQIKEPYWRDEKTKMERVLFLMLEAEHREITAEENKEARSMMGTWGDHNYWRDYCRVGPWSWSGEYK